MVKSFIVLQLCFVSMQTFQLNKADLLLTRLFFRLLPWTTHWTTRVMNHLISQEEIFSSLSVALGIALMKTNGSDDNECYHWCVWNTWQLAGLRRSYYKSSSPPTIKLPALCSTGRSPIWSSPWCLSLYLWPDWERE